MNNMTENILTIEQATINIFIPLDIKKRGGTAMIITPQGIESRREDVPRNFDSKLLKSIAKAHKWKSMLETNNVSSLADIARKEKLTTGYVSKVFNLNFLSPKIVDRILEGTEPRTLRLQDIVTNEIPDLWQEQEEAWGF